MEVGTDTRLDGSLEELVPGGMQRLLAVRVAVAVAIGRGQVGSVENIHTQGTHVVDAFLGVQFHLHGDIATTNGDLAHLAGVGAEDELGGVVLDTSVSYTRIRFKQTYQNALERRQSITGQRGNDVFLIVVLVILLIDQAQGNLGELKLTNKGLANCIELVVATKQIAIQTYCRCC
jgi:hypothetical protein